MRVPLALAIVVLAGCLQSGANDDGDEPADATRPAAGERPDGARARHALYDFAMGHPNRHAGFPAEMEAARQFLRATLVTNGAVVADQDYGSGTNVLGLLPGTAQPDDWLVLSCHMDTIETTVYGARDDGLGCAALLEMARAFATWTWNRTIAFAFFDEEEQGLVGSAAFVEDALEHAEVRIVADLNFDPAGLHWPCGDASGPYDIQLFITQSKLGEVPGYQELLDAVLAGLADAGAPADSVKVATSHAYASAGEQHFLPPGSDDDSFDDVDIPSIWFGGPPTDQVGDNRVWGYPNHTPPDTAQLVELRCGSADLLEQGLQVAMDGAFGALRRLDAMPPQA